MARWWKAHLALFRKIPLTQSHLNEELINDLILREGMRNLICRLHESAIPIMVFSAGIAQVIDLVLERDFGTEHPMEVIANRLTFCPE
jgi:2-hydroxy-3-keto-5-methylthiopentenyl-1-phosphate phosphatase